MCFSHLCIVYSLDSFMTKKTSCSVFELKSEFEILNSFPNGNWKRQTLSSIPSCDQTQLFKLIDCIIYPSLFMTITSLQNTDVSSHLPEPSLQPSQARNHNHHGLQEHLRAGKSAQQPFIRSRLGTHDSCPCRRFLSRSLPAPSWSQTRSGICVKIEKLIIFVINLGKDPNSQS